MSKKHKRSLKFKALADSLNATRAAVATSSNAAASIADSRALWASAPIVLKQMELRCEEIKVTLKHPQPFLLLTAIDHSCRMLIHFEIHRRSTLPTVEAFVRRAEAAFPTGLWSYFVRAGQQRPMA